ncbi:MAG: deoxyribonuclease IV [Verrucomicrobiota bacterium]|nr:deoxyribonuclease IV [Verrucomicrobiota bacterium]
MKQQIWIGAHTSAAGGVQEALYEGQEIGATAIQLFTSNQKQWNGRTLSQEEIDAWQKALEKTGIGEVMSHDSYLINLGAANPEILQKSRKAFREEIQRCHALRIPYMNFHPGAATTSTEEQCLEMIVESLLAVEDLAQEGPTRLLLEATAGQGTSIGHKFEHLAYILERTHQRIPIGVCIDTCHIFVAGYDIRTEEAWGHTLRQFDEIVGLEHLRAFHLNDSMKEFGSRVDRHASLGKGHIGLEAFRFVMTHPKLRFLPKYLETPEGPPVWKQEIELLKKFMNEHAHQN